MVTLVGLQLHSHQVARSQSLLRSCAGPKHLKNVAIIVLCVLGDIRSEGRVQLQRVHKK